MSNKKLLLAYRSYKKSIQFVSKTQEFEQYFEAVDSCRDSIATQFSVSPEDLKNLTILAHTRYIDRAFSN